MSLNGESRPTHAGTPQGGMDIFDGLKVLARRWYVVLPILLVTAVLAFTTHQNTAKSYTGDATIGITTGSISRQAAIPSGSPTISHFNALVQSGGTVLLANLLTIGLQQPSAVEKVIAANGTPSYTVAVVERNQSLSQLPIITVTATAGNPQEVITTLRTVQQLAEPTLRTLQANAGVPSDKLATPFVVQTISSPTLKIPSRVRATATVMVVGLVVAIVLAAVVDVILRRRRPRSRIPARPPMRTEAKVSAP